MLGPNVAPLLTAIAAVLKSFAWPFAATTIAFLFRRQIVEVAAQAGKRLANIELPGGAKFAFSSVVDQAKAEDAGQRASTTLRTDVPDLPPPTPGVAKMERELKAVLDTIPADQQIARLTRGLAFQSLNAGFAFIYDIIFGSQIKGLMELRARRRVPATEALAFFLPYAEQYPKVYESYGFVGWIGFLRDKELIEAVDGDSYQITPFGDEFLLWLQQTKLSPDKAG